MYKTKLLWTLVIAMLYFVYFHLYKHRTAILSRGFTLGKDHRFDAKKQIEELHVETLLFIKYWNLQRQMRFDHNRLMEPCKNDMKWLPFYRERTYHKVTSMEYSNVLLYIKPVGQYSRFVIETYSKMNTRKNMGGDFWRVFVKGTTSVPVTILDNLDGSYEASFLILEPGFYHIELYLEYTLCDGMKDPPDDWFSKGNDQGKGQSKRALYGYREKPYLEEQYPRNLSFRVRHGKYNLYKELYDRISNKTLRHSCLMWDGFGQWNESLHWTPYIKTDPITEHSSVKVNNEKGTLWIFGDSVGDFFYKSILRTPLCKYIFRTCNRTYNWVYNLPNGKPARPNQLPYTGSDFNLTRLLRELEIALTNPAMDENSVLILNYGLHYAMSISLERFKAMINAVIKLLNNSRYRYNGTLIWKSTTALQKWKYGTPESNARHSVSGRFLTEQRVELYNAVSSRKFCEAGFNVLDVFPMSYSYPNGTGWNHKPWDAVHYNKLAFLPVQQYLQHFFDSIGKV